MSQTPAPQLFAKATMSPALTNLRWQVMGNKDQRDVAATNEVGRALGIAVSGSKWQKRMREVYHKNLAHMIAPSFSGEHASALKMYLAEGISTCGACNVFYLPHSAHVRLLCVGGSNSLQGLVVLQPTACGHGRCRGQWGDPRRHSIACSARSVHHPSCASRLV